MLVLTALKVYNGVIFICKCETTRRQNTENDLHNDKYGRELRFQTEKKNHKLYIML